MEQIAEPQTAHKFGYVPDTPDARDFFLRMTVPIALPTRVDLRENGHLPGVYDQGQLGSCVANSSCAALQYAERSAGEPDIMRSRLELYYYARSIEHSIHQDSGCQIRDAFKAMNKKGVCPESDWPYDISRFDVRPSSAATKHNQKLVQYQRVGQSETELKTALAQGLPIVFGFLVYESLETKAVAETGLVPLPNTLKEKILGGHAVLLVGYDDTRQHWICRNSWSDTWGDKGYFYMPYSYVLNPKLASDFWVVNRY